MSSSRPPLAPFDPLVRHWFEGRYGAPTEVQRRAWPEISAGRHVLATAPTGSGKTLAAFLWALDRLLSGAWDGGGTRVLYVSPLKALNNDVERNLLAPLEELGAAFLAAGQEPCPVRVATRSGDTPQTQRRRMARHPPEILITTPESLNLLLASESGRSMLRTVRGVILDEIHAVAGTKRGIHLMTAVERLALLAGEAQRVALSATVRPLARIARWVGGRRLEPSAGGDARYHPRAVVILDCAGPKGYEVGVDFPAEPVPTQSSGSQQLAPGAVAGSPDGRLVTAEKPPGDDTGRFWPRLIAELLERIRANRSTLLFANSRRLAEKITRFLNEAAGAEIAWSHHGSLARELRLEVERRFKAGHLPALVATSSLELGIDIGDLEEVLLLETPPSASSAIQRVGRAGHRVGAVSRGRFYPLHGLDLLAAAIAARAVLERDVEETTPVSGALDVLAQVLLSMTAVETWEVDALYDAVRTAEPYRELPRRHFDLVLEMLAGRYADSRLPELTPRLAVDRVAGTVQARRGVRRLLYLSGGTIPDRGHFHLRLDRSMAKLGELDEEFVWERSVGDRFVLGAQTWRIVQITHSDVLVAPAGGGTAAMAPFWRGEERDRTFFLGERLARLLELAEGHLQRRERDRLLALLASRYAFTARAAESLVALLESQRSVTGRALPHRHHLLAERVRDPQDPQAPGSLILHTFWGGRVNRPLALALEAAWEERGGAPLEVFHDDHAIMAVLASEVDARELLALVAPDRLEELLQRRLEATGFFGARFRENAGRALLLPRGDGRRRVPLWLNRQRSRKLLETVSRYRDFPMVLETWRSCLQEELELEALRRLLTELETEEIEISETVTSAPSPFAAGLSWRLTNRLMYEDDTPQGRGPGLRPDLVEEVAFADALRPRIPTPLAEALTAKLQRTAPGYSPAPEELLSWVVERVAMPEQEWRQLVAAMTRDHDLVDTDWIDLFATLANRLARLSWAPGVADQGEDASAPEDDVPMAVVVAVEQVPRVLAALGRTLGAARLTAVAHGPGAGGGAAFLEPSAATADHGLPEELRKALAALSPTARPAGEGGPVGSSGAEAAAAGHDAAGLLTEWLRYYGPIPRELPARLFALPAGEMTLALDALTEERRVVTGPLLEGAQGVEICDAENLKRLLRMVRVAARPELVPLPLDQLSLFLALHQGLAQRRDGIEGVELALDRLLGWCAPAEAWESDLLPARVDPYYTSWLDTLMQESDLMWVGCGRQRLTFCSVHDPDLVVSNRPERASRLDGTALEEGLVGNVDAIFPSGPGRFTLLELASHSGRAPGQVVEALWDAAWRGEATNDSFSAVRRGILSRYRPPQPRGPTGPPGEGAPRRWRRGQLGSWRESRPFPGHWYPVSRGREAREEPDPLELEELQRERARILLERYGVLFRELVSREAPPFQWRAIFRSLRVMELSGEVLAGHFFAGVPGLQFASPAAYRRLRRGLPQDAVWWVAAIDPASPCGLALEGLPEGLPRRSSGHHLVFHGSSLVLTSQRRGRRLEILVSPDHPHLPHYLQVLEGRLTRQFAPERSLEVALINGLPAADSPYAPLLAARFQVTSGAGTLRLWRRYS